jgi:hypothetical protein
VWSNGQVVLKQTDNLTEATELAQILEAVDFDNVRIPRPVRSGAGEVVVDGWTASTHLAGRRLARGRWADRVRASRAISKALVDLPRPRFFETTDHMWTRGARIAWGDEAWTPPKPWRALADQLREAAGVIDPPRQLIHGDITGNTLTGRGLDLGVVDFAPTWESALWSECMVITDGLLWFKAPSRSVDLLDSNDAGPMLCRTTLFRLVVHCLWLGATRPDDVEHYRPVVGLVTTV